MTEQSAQIGDNKDRNEKGQFIKGNVLGRMPKKGFNLHDLNKLVLEFEKSPENEKGSLLKHYIKQLFKNDRLLAKYMDKNIATKTIHELMGEDGEPININLIEKIYPKEPEKAEKSKVENAKTVEEQPF